MPKRFTVPEFRWNMPNVKEDFEQRIDTVTLGHTREFLAAKVALKVFKTNRKHLVHVSSLPPPISLYTYIMEPVYPTIEPF
jgi:hypothetical protein